MGRALVCLVLGLWLFASGRDGLDRWVAATELPGLVHETGSEVRDRSGLLLRAYTVNDGLWRLPVTLDQIDPTLIDMLIAYEDKRFYDHAGVDWRAVVRAGGQALWNRRVVSGASTLTMQVARLLEDAPTGDWGAKLRQMRVALALERQLDKRQILSLYAVLAPYGGNVEGIRAASLVWLGKEPKRLTPAQAALLVALPQAPEARRPDRHPDAARAARDRVLMRMAAQGVLEADLARASLRDASPGGRHTMPRLAPHLADRLVASRPGRHDVTLDAALQARIEDLVSRDMANRDPRLSVAVMVVDHHTGAVRVSVGSKQFAATGQGFVDMTQARRSPGSTLKPLVYGLAFDRGIVHPETLILDTPVQFDRYAPQNFDRVFRGELSVRQALHLSLNIPVIRLTDALGPAHLMAGLRATGADPALSGGVPGLAMALGGVGMTLHDMMGLYTMLARGGTAIPLTHTPAETGQATRVLSPAAAWHLGQILSQNPPAGLGRPGQVAYKTGTSYGHRDAWALGWDGQHVAGVWIGRPDGTPVPGAFGGDLAAPLLFQTLERVRTGPSPLPPPPPETLLVSNAALPAPLQRFGTRTDPVLTLIFPPQGATLQADAMGVPLKLRGGTPPYTVMANGAVIATGLRRTQMLAPQPGPGFATYAVIDALGRSSGATIELR